VRIIGAELNLAPGLSGSMIGAGASPGQVIGGALTNADIAGPSWRHTFLVNLPAGLAGHCARAPADGTTVSWGLLWMPPSCADACSVGIRRAIRGPSDGRFQAPFRRRQNPLIGTTRLMSAPDRRAVQIGGSARGYLER